MDPVTLAMAKSYTDGKGVSNQLTKLGVTAPSVNDLAIPFTTTFLKSTPNVLKFTPGADGQVHTTVAFDNGDETDFEEQTQVIFDGVMKLKTSYTAAMVNEGAIGSGTLWSYAIPKSTYKLIENMDVVME